MDLGEALRVAVAHGHAGPHGPEAGVGLGLVPDRRLPLLAVHLGEGGHERHVPVGAAGQGGQQVLVGVAAKGQR